MTKRIALIALLLVVVLGAGPGRGCKKDTGLCADFGSTVSATWTASFNGPVIVEWEDDVNTTESYHIEQFTDAFGWAAIGPAIILSDENDPPGLYSEFFWADPSATAFRVVASCGETSAEVEPL